MKKRVPRGDTEEVDDSAKEKFAYDITSVQRSLEFLGPSGEVYGETRLAEEVHDQVVG